MKKNIISQPFFLDFDLFYAPEYKIAQNRINGQGQKGVIILFETNEEHTELASFLKKVLSAAKLVLDKDASLIALTTDENLSFSGLCQQTDVRYLLSFGITPERIGLQVNCQKYAPFKFKDVQFLFADPLVAIYEERQQGGKKMSGALWKALQALFLK